MQEKENRGTILLPRGSSDNIYIKRIAVRVGHQTFGLVTLSYKEAH